MYLHRSAEWKEIARVRSFFADPPVNRWTCRKRFSERERSGVSTNAPVNRWTYRKRFSEHVNEAVCQRMHL